MQTNKDELKAALDTEELNNPDVALFAPDMWERERYEFECKYGRTPDKCIEQAASEYLSLLDDIQALIEAHSEWQAAAQNYEDNIKPDEFHSEALCIASRVAKEELNTISEVARIMAEKTGAARKAHFITTAANIIAKWKEKV